MADAVDKGRTIARTVLIIDALAAEPAGLDLTEIARRADMSLPGAHRALSALIAVGVASQEGPRRRYRLGPRVLEWSSKMTLENRLLAISDEILETANEESGETVLLTILRDRMLWDIVNHEGHGHLLSRATRGGQPYLHNSARGLVFLAFLPRVEAEDIIKVTGQPPVPRGLAITDPAELWALADRIRRKGFVWRRNGTITGMCAIAVPVLEPGGGILASIAIELAAVHMAEKEKLVEAVALRAAADLAERWARTNVWSG